MSFSLPPNSASLERALVEGPIARLRAEVDASDDPSRAALLLGEVGALEEAIGDDAAAARDLLGAVNAASDSREPLYSLVGLIERRRSYKNLGKLLARLAAVAETAAERDRATYLQAAFELLQQDDAEAARDILEPHLETQPDSAEHWLLLELVAGKLGDEALRRRALRRRAETCLDPTWKAWLLVGAAALEREAGELEVAVGSLEAAVACKGTATFNALQELERAGAELGRQDVVARALETQAQLIVRAISDPALGETFGVPAWLREDGVAADRWLRAASAHRRQGDLEASGRLLAQAAEKLPNEPALLQARLRHADAVRDATTSAALAASELENGVTGAAAAALHWRVAEAAAGAEDIEGALAALDRALGEQPACVPARVLQVDFLGSGGDPRRLAEAFTEVAATQDAPDAQVRFHLLAAEVWSRLVGDASAARAALSSATSAGASPATVARVGRMLAALGEHGDWYAEATRRLVESVEDDSERASLWTELLIGASSAGDPEAISSALTGLSELPGGAWLAHALAAYGGERFPWSRAEAADDAGPGEALRMLAQNEADPASARALRFVAALRDRDGGLPEAAAAELTGLHQEQPQDLLVVRVLVGLLREAGSSRVARVLGQCADGTESSKVAAILRIEAGLSAWSAGDRAAAVEAFGLASEAEPDATRVLLTWALRAAAPDDGEGRLRALDAAATSGDSPGVAALERFAIHVGRDALAASDVLASDVDDPEQGVTLAVALARALWAGEGSDETLRRSALDEVARVSPVAAASSRATAYLSERADGAIDPEALQILASAWASADMSLPAALEWLALTLVTGDRESEVDARRRLASLTDGPLSEAIAASAASVEKRLSPTVQLLTGDADCTRLMNLELSPPGCDPRRRASSLVRLAGRLGAEDDPLLHGIAGWNYLAAGDLNQAASCFRAMTTALPRDVGAWEGLRAAAQAAGDRGLLAEASAALGDAVSDDAEGAALWEEAAGILIDELGNAAVGEHALGRAVARDIGRFSSFDRLFRIVRARKDGPALLALVEARLAVAEEPEEIAKLFWERARVLRKAGDTDGALTALENVTMLEPDHVGALALTGEIHLTQKRFPEAAENLARLATLAAAPNQQRLMSGVAAVDILENKLGDSAAALEVLRGLYHAGLSTLPVRERLAKVAARLEAWEPAVEVLEELMRERNSSEGRVEAARLAMVIRRDRAQKPGSALAAVRSLLTEVPDDDEALDLVLSGCFDDGVAAGLLEAGRTALVRRLMESPADPERVGRLAAIAEQLRDEPLKQAALGCVVALGGGDSRVDRELSRLDERVARTPQMAIGPAEVDSIADPGDRGPLAELFRLLAPTLAEALGPGLEALGVGRKERVKASAGLPIRNEIAAWMGALGLGEFELYVGGPNPGDVVGIPGDTPALVVGDKVTAPLDPEHRQLVAREVFALVHGTSILRHRESQEIAAMVVAACKVVGVRLDAPQYAMLAEFERQLGKAMPRKVKKALPVIAEALRGGYDPAEWASAATSTLDRLAAIAAGDASWVLADGVASRRGAPAQSEQGRVRASRLMSFVLSPAYLDVKATLGMGVK